MDLQKALEYRNSRNLFCKQLGITVTELSLGYAKTVKEVTAEDVNPIGVATVAFTSPWRTLPRFRHGLLRTQGRDPQRAVQLLPLRQAGRYADCRGAGGQAWWDCLRL